MDDNIAIMSMDTLRSSLKSTADQVPSQTSSIGKYDLRPRLSQLWLSGFCLPTYHNHHHHFNHHHRHHSKAKKGWENCERRCPIQKNEKTSIDEGVQPLDFEIQVYYSRNNYILFKTTRWRHTYLFSISKQICLIDWQRWWRWCLGQMVEGTISYMVDGRTSASIAVVMPWCGISDHTTDDKHMTAGIIAPNLGGVAINPAIVVLSRFRWASMVASHPPLIFLIFKLFYNIKSL